MLELREKEILLTLEKIKSCEFVIIGGYAVNTYTQPRFSVDCDIVVKNKEEALKIKQLLMKEGYAQKEVNLNIPYASDFLCMIKRVDDFSVPFDIMIGSVIDRNTKSRFMAALIFENSEIKKLKGKINPIEIELKIAKPEILMIMKLAASRTSDLRDIFMLLEGNIELERCLLMIKEYNLKASFEKFREFVNSKSFKDNLHGVFGKIDEKVFNKILRKINNIVLLE
ncbi:hypothetical protein HY636_06465 [Candidatus Woesearchaeota archaeon]|nr:hypothetical protein [Candidatus Woesearchaeota archaeon]